MTFYPDGGIARSRPISVDLDSARCGASGGVAIVLQSESPTPRWRGPLAQRRLGAAGRRGPRLELGAAIRPSRIASLRASLRARRIASAFSRTLFSDGFS